MTTYRLPAELGGIEVRNAGMRGDGRLILVPVAPELAELDWEFCLDQGALTEVKPPLPPEPPVRTVVLDREGDAWIRNASEDRPWACFDLSADWKHLNDRYGPVTVMVPDPVASAPELPFSLDSCNVVATVAVDRDNAGTFVAICACNLDHQESERYTPDEAERIGYAILRAAREARAAL